MEIFDSKTAHTFTLLANQVFDMEKRVARIPEAEKLQRNLRRMKQALEEAGIRIHDPLGEEWTETRTDCEASISGSATQGLVILEVIKPILRMEENGLQKIIQRGVVVVGKK